MVNVKAKSPWPYRVAKYVMRFGTAKFSLLFLIIASVIAVIESALVLYWFDGEVTFKGVLPTLFFTIISGPLLLYFMFELIARLQASRVELTKAISKLEALHKQDALNAVDLNKNIEELNHQIEERKRAELQRKDAIRLLQQEIEERKKTERSLYDQSVLLRSCFDCSPDIIYYRDENGCFAGCNSSLEALTSMSEKEMIGLTPWDVYTKEVAEKVVASDKEVLSTNASISYDIWLTFPDGMKRLYEFKKVPFFNEDGKRIGLLGFGRDVMERKLAQDALEQASRDKTSFISTISHELRTPLNGIVGISRMLQESRLSEQQRKHAEVIYACAITLGNIFNDIIDLDRIERDKLEVNLEGIELSALVNELATVSELQASQKGLRFEFSHNLPDILWVRTDPTRLRQVLWNLLANAVKFTLDGNVELHVDCQMAGDSVWLDFEIKDSGIGICEDEVDNIFSMYYQVDRSEVRSGTGTGIGLAVSKKLVDALGGQIEVYSELNKGSVFTVSIQADVIEEPEKAKDVIDMPELRILLVEDVELNINVACSILDKMGHTITVARTGTEAIEKYQPAEFDLLLLDIKLPDMTGFDVAAQVQEDDPDCPPMIALTANVVKSKEAYLDQGLSDVIAKPIRIEQMVEVFSKIFVGDEQKEQAKIGSKQVKVHAQNVLDTDFIEQMLQAIGYDCMLENLALFDRIIADYVSALDAALAINDDKEVGAQAHKIKGSAASIGLKNIQMIANDIQEIEEDDWQDKLHGRVEKLKIGCHDDVNVLKAWLAE